MKFDKFQVYVGSLCSGCINRIGEMENYSEIEEYDWYAETHNELSGTLMSLQTEYYNEYDD